MEEDVKTLMEPYNQSTTPPDAAAEPAPPIDSRFLFVDVAALRAKQLRRGARMRIVDTDLAHIPKKAERIAMEEVRRGLVSYDMPVRKPVPAEDEP
jgi:DNA-directed RNA polymerase omega subunit